MKRKQERTGMKQLKRRSNNAPHIISGFDWFSELPEHIIHRILSFVPMKDAARTCILSKTWRRLCSSYNIVPSLHYDHNSFALQLLLNAESEPKIDEIRDKFMDYADNHLRQVIQQQSLVFKLEVDVAVIDSEFACVDQFMDLVRKIKVQELSIFVQTRDFHWYDELFEGCICYEFPYSLILASEWLESLTVKGCKFTNQLSLPANNSAGMFSSLRQLRLSQVMLSGEEALNNIARCCPGIELIDFAGCTLLFPTLKLSKFPKLKKASVYGDQYGLENVDITETSLECFHAISVDTKYLISRAACSNIRELELDTCTVNQPDLLRDFTTYFPLLEKAILSDVTVSPSEDSFDSIIVANPHLKTLELLFNRDIKVLRVDCPKLRNFRCSATGEFEKIYLNCPKLRTCYYSLTEVPSLILLDLPTNIQYVFFSFIVFCALQKSWFISFRKFLQQIGGCNNVILQLQISLNRHMIMADFVLDEFPKVQTSKLNNVLLQVEIVDLDGEGAQILSVPLVDGLVWSIQPATLRVGGRSCYDFVKYLCEKLAEKSEDKSCCDQQLCNKYWWHNISDFQVKHRNKDMKQNLASLVEMCKQSHRGYRGQLSSVDRAPTCFVFEWRHSIEMYTT